MIQERAIKIPFLQLDVLLNLVVKRQSTNSKGAISMCFLLYIVKLLFLFFVSLVTYLFLLDSFKF